MLTIQYMSEKDTTLAADCMLVPSNHLGIPAGSWFIGSGISAGELKAGSSMSGGRLPVGQAIFYLLRNQVVRGVTGCCVMDDQKPATEASMRKALYYGFLVVEANRMKIVGIPLEDWMLTGIEESVILQSIAEILRRIQSETAFIEQVVFMDSNQDRVKALESRVVVTLS